MRSFVILMVASSLTLSACSAWRDSRVNPSNWFGSSRPAPVATAENPNPLIPERESIFDRRVVDDYQGTLVADVTELAVEPTSTGGIIRATGVTSRQGAHDIRLVNETDGEPVDGVLTFELRALQPRSQGVGGTTARTVRAGTYVSSEVLARTRSIRVEGGSSARTTAR